jgi:hypothetical protein
VAYWRQPDYNVSRYEGISAPQAGADVLISVNMEINLLATA